MRQFLFLAAALALCACNTTTTMGGTSPQAPAPEGNLRLSLTLGSVGVLARTMTMTPTRLILEFSGRPGGQDRVLRDTVAVSGSGQWTKDYSLEAGGAWTLAVWGQDQRDSVLYRGQEAVSVLPNRTTVVAMSLSARYSSLQVRFPVLDSFERFVLKVDGAVWGDSSVVAQARLGDTIVLSHDYLLASPTGEAHNLSLRVYGRYWNQQTVLYALDTGLQTVSGAGGELPLALSWVGPRNPPQGLARIQVQLGEVGRLVFQVGYQNPVTGGLDTGSMVDPRTGWRYSYKRFGTQVWMLANIGSTCPGCSPVGNSYEDPTLVLPTDPWFDPTQFVATSDYRTACPSGWHVPDTSEWRTLVRFAAAGEADSVGNAHLRSTDGWFWVNNRYEDYDNYPDTTSTNGDNALGFNVLPAWDWSHEMTGESRSQAEMWTSTPGAPVVIFDATRVWVGYNFHWAWGYMPLPHFSAQVRCLMD